MLGAIKVSPESLDNVVERISKQYGVKSSLMKAFIKAESNWDVNASRYEAHLNDTSWGLMQILLTTGRNVLGDQSLTIAQLITPEINIEIGTKFIAQLFTRFKGNMMDVISAYNAGTPRKDKYGVYINQSYVNKVYGFYVMYSTLEDVKEAGTQAMKQITSATSEITSDPFLMVGVAAIAGLGILLIMRK